MLGHNLNLDPSTLATIKILRQEAIADGFPFGCPNQQTYGNKERLDALGSYSL